MTEFDPQIHGPELSAYLDGELDAAQRAAVERLLADSPAARRELKQLRVVSTGVRGLSRHAAPEALFAALRESDHRHDAHSEPPPAPQSNRRIWKIRVWINTLATAAALGLVWIVGRAFVNTNPATGELARVSADPSALKNFGALDRAGAERVAMGGIAAPPGAPTAAGATGAPTVARLAKPAGLSQDPVLKESLSAGVSPDQVPLSHDFSIGRLSGFLGGGEAARAEPARVCNVVVNSRSPEEYEAIQTWVADQFRRQANTMNFGAAIPDGNMLQRPEILQMQLPSSELAPVLTSLGDRVAPGVSIAIEFAPFPVREADIQMADRSADEVKSESRDAVTEKSEQGGRRGIAAAGYAGSLRESTEFAGDVKKKEAAVAENKPRAAAEAAPPVPATAAAPPALAERNRPSRSTRELSKEPVGRDAGRGAGDDKKVAAKADRDDAEGRSATGAEGAKDQIRKTETDTPGVAPPASGAASRGALNEDAETVENRSASHATQNRLAIQNELNQAIQQQSQSIMPIPLRFALPQLQNRIASEKVTVNLIVNRPPPISSQPASSPNP